MKKEVGDGRLERMSAREELIERLVGAIDAVVVDHPVRVAIDGPDAAGKTTLANELAAVLRGEGRPVVRASIDGFHRSRADRYARGTNSPIGYFEDSFDNDSLRRVLLDPLGPSGSRSYRTRVFDFKTDQLIDDVEREADRNAVLLFDGVFLLRDELRDEWDYSIFVDAPFDETLRRAVVRDAELMGDAESVERRYRERYIPGQELYFAAVGPSELADVVVHNADPGRPSVTFRS